MEKYSAGKYEPMPSERWGVWKDNRRDSRLIALIPEGPRAMKMAEKIAAAMNSAK